MTELEKWKNLAKVENGRMLEPFNGVSPNYGIIKQKVRGCGGPRMAEMERSKPAQRLLRLAEQGFSLAEASRITSMSVEEVIAKSNRYQIKFKGSNEGYGQG